MADERQDRHLSATAFTWPPRRVVAIDLAEASGDDPGSASESAGMTTKASPKAGPFGVLPTPTQAEVDDPAGVNDSTPDVALPAASDFERTWLGLLSPPWRWRVEEAQFSVDEPSAYCPRCGGSVGLGEVVVDQAAGASVATGCASCRQTTLPWTRAVRLGVFSGVLRTAILEAKYTRWRRLAHDLGLSLGRSLVERLSADGVDPSHAALVPVPMSWRRRWSRGFDHTLAIARGVRAVLGCPLLRPLRRHHRPVQASLPSSAREANARGSFRAVGSARLDAFPAVVVLDDVRTTGATLRAACRALAVRERRLGGALSSDYVWIAALAVARERDRRPVADRVSAE